MQNIFDDIREALTVRISTLQITELEKEFLIIWMHLIKGRYIFLSA